MSRAALMSTKKILRDEKPFSVLFSDGEKCDETVFPDRFGEFANSLMAFGPQDTVIKLRLVFFGEREQASSPAAGFFHCPSVGQQHRCLYGVAHLFPLFIR